MRYLLIVFFLIFSGCSTKVFEPKSVSELKLKEKSGDFQLSQYTKKTLTFSTLTLKRVKKNNIFDDGLRVEKVYYDQNGTKLGKFITINKNLAANGKKLLVISEKKVYKLPFLIYSASMKNSTVAVVFENGKYGIYDLNEKRMKAIFDGDEVLSVKYMHADPLFYRDLILFPLLSGNVAVVDAAKDEFIRTLNISQNQFNDNVIFLKIVNNKLFMATPSKLILFDPKFLIDFKADIKHIIDYKNDLYVFTSDGEIIKLDSNLKVLKRKKLPYASFFAPNICKGNIWSVEKQGYLLKITPDLNITVYEEKQLDTNYDTMLRMRGCKIYDGYKVFVIE